MAERPIHHQPDQLDTLFVQLDRAKKVRQKEHLADEAIRVATEENFDYISVLRVLDKGTSLMIQGQRDTGLRILTGVDNYFQALRFSSKVLDQEELHKFPYAVQLTSSVSRNIGIIVKRFELQDLPGLSGFFKGLAQEIEPVGKNGGMPSDTSVVQVLPFVTPVTAQLYFDSLRPLLESSIDRYNLDLAGPERLKIPEREIAALKANGDHPFDTVHFIWQEKINGESLETILEEQDQEQFNWKSLQYLGKAIRGDDLRESALKTIYYTAPFIRMSHYQQGLFQNEDIARRLYSFHYWLGEKLFLSALEPSKQDSEFDAYFEKMIRAFQVETVLEIGQVLYGALVERFYSERLFRDPESPDDIKKANQLVAQAFLEWETNVPASPDTVVHMFLSKHRTNIDESLEMRFKSTRANTLRECLDEYIGALDQLINQNAEIVMKFFTKFNAEKMKNGSQEIEMINAEKKGFVDAINAQVKKWPPFEKGEYHAYGTQNSYYEQLGFDKIAYYRHVDKDELSFNWRALEGTDINGSIQMGGTVQYDDLAILDAESCVGVRAVLDDLVIAGLHYSLVNEGYISLAEQEEPTAVKRVFKPKGYWTSEKTLKEARSFKEEHGDFSPALLRKHNREDIYNALRKYPGGPHAAYAELGWEAPQPSLEEIKLRMDSLLEDLNSTPIR